MTEPKKVLPKTWQEINDRMSAGQHIGVQLYVSLNAEPVIDLGVGKSRPGVKMTSDTLMAWFSSTKTVMPVAIAQLWELWITSAPPNFIMLAAFCGAKLPGQPPQVEKPTNWISSVY